MRMAGGGSRPVIDRLDDLSTALLAGDDRLDPGAVKTSTELIERIGERLRLGGERTVVALVGATGSGKSSLFNALAGIELAEVGVRRPTTGQPSACIWSGEGADPLLDWLEVPRTMRTNRESVLDGTQQSDLHGLVLLDLPDHDSTQLAHRLEVERLVELVDLLVWIVDPQKYADEVLHAYLRKLTGHAGVMLVVLNQLDRLSAAEAQTCATDLRRLLDADGLGSVALLATSARTGAGVVQLRSLLADLVARRGAFAGRALADIEASVAQLRPGLASSEPQPERLPGSDQLVDALVEAAGLPVLTDAVTADYQRRAAAETDWPPLRWYRNLRPDRLARVGLAADQEEQVRRLTSATVAAPTTAQRERVELAVREVTAATARDLPQPWADAVHSAAVATSDELSQALDAAVGEVDIAMTRPAWWPLLSLVQIGLLAAAVVGLVWWLLVATGVVGSPSLGGVSAAAVLFGGAVVLGAVLALGSRWLVRLGARHRRARVTAQLRDVVSAVADARVIGPIAAVVVDHRTARLALEGRR
jgi:GTP-binding protein EngB required for normal cell division